MNIINKEKKIVCPQVSIYHPMTSIFQVVKHGDRSETDSKTIDRIFQKTGEKSMNENDSYSISYEIKNNDSIASEPSTCV